MRIFRDKTEKDTYRIRTKHGIVDVTEDPSLLNKIEKILNPVIFLVIYYRLSHDHFNFITPKKHLMKIIIQILI